jgi:hypothetical protein
LVQLLIFRTLAFLGERFAAGDANSVCNANFGALCIP